MPDALLKISGGTVYDPASGVDGQVQDIWVQGGKIVAAPSDPAVRPSRTIDAAGLAVMPGGVDMHCHIAGAKVNAARRLLPDQRRGEANAARRTPLTRSGTLGSVPSTFTTGYKYAGLGYTTAIDAAVSPLLARHTHDEFADTPCIDKGFLALVGNNHYILDALAAGDDDRTDAFIAWLLGAVQGYGLKVVNPGGVEAWKQQAGGNVHSLDDVVPHFDVTPRQILCAVAAAADRLQLPHAVHIHCNNLGLPGNWRTTLATMQALEGRRGHLTHIQFHSYAGGDEDETTFGSQVGPLADYVNAHDNLTVDVGQVMFGPTTSMTGDGPVGHYLSRLYGSRWYSSDTELESGCGVA
ncbi:MAG: formylmethanofuran dehydrogenase subunit A, partial [Planctomycetales bacterium]|nr:formylmethanofuran dehydrogenase subunit A [Planctomycetales bacterium]